MALSLLAKRAHFHPTMANLPQNTTNTTNTTNITNPHPGSYARLKSTENYIVYIIKRACFSDEQTPNLGCTTYHLRSTALGLVAASMFFI